jgi:hypothetical protein
VSSDADYAMSAAMAIVARHRKRPNDLDPHDLALLLTEWASVPARPEMTIFVARDSGGDPVALAAVVIDQELCLIQIAIACDHAGRWAPHDHIVRALIERGARVLFAEGEGRSELSASSPRSIASSAYSATNCGTWLRGPDGRASGARPAPQTETYVRDT